MIKLITFILIMSCSGYQLTTRHNIFQEYGISTLRVPTFYNQTPLNNISRFFTAEFSSQLSELKGLRVTHSDQSSQGVLIGLITSPLEHDEVLKPDLFSQINLLAPNRAKNLATNKENKNLIPVSNRLQFQLHLYLVKNVYRDRLSFEQLKAGSLFHKKINIDIRNIPREVHDGADFVINTTQNERLIEKVLAVKAKSVANDFIKQKLNEF